LDSEPNLNQFLKSDVDLKNFLRPTKIPNLCLITSKPIFESPIELLSTERLNNLVATLKQTFDFVLIDAPPLLAVSDALAMGSIVDRVILVARGGQTPMRAMKQAKQKLDAHKLNCMGVILNGVDLIEQDGYYARQYYHYSATQGSDTHQKSPDGTKSKV
jgi:capsular exopolysaccharide synthesis family protein